MSDAPSLKDFVDPDLVARLAARVRAVHPAFDADGFITAVMGPLGNLELKNRMALIADELAEHLPPGYPEAVAIVVAAADHPELPIDGWSAWPLNTFVERHGVAHPEESLDAMERLTRHMSSEFAIRPFLEHHREKTLARLQEWVGHGDAAVRRLVSEGTRPLLPWGPRVTGFREDPEPGLALIAGLVRDPSETVRRSVANHLNDVSKDHPDRAVKIAREWLQDGQDETKRLVAHSMRTLVKRGHPGALEILGFATTPDVTVLGFTCTPDTVSIGEHTVVSGRVRSTGSSVRKLVLDLVVHYVKANGSTSAKVFKGKVAELGPDDEVEIRRKLSLHDMTTRKHHPGNHRVELQIAGHVVAETEFELRATNDERRART